MDSPAASPAFSPLLLVLYAWSLLWKGIALWNSSKHSQRNWFIVMLVINTVGILEIVYLFGFAKKKMTLKDLYFWRSKSKE
jgi:hypothetical protein